MTPSPHPTGRVTRRRSHHASTGGGRLRVVLLTALLTALLLGGGAGAAQAHDQLVSTSPADGATVATVPAALTLTFSNTPIGLGDEVKVLDPSGTDQSDGPVSVTDTVATQKIKAGAPAGRYTVEWRVVSSDSHPIEGSFSFTARAEGAASGAASGADASGGAADGSSAKATAGTGSASPVAEAPAAASGSNHLPIVVIVVGVIVLAGFGVWMLRSSRRRGDDARD